MHKLTKLFISITLVVILLFSAGCYGSFSLTKKLYNWNGTVGDTIINSVVMVAFHIIPVYGVCVFADVLVLNSIEFFTGNNPVAMNENESETKIVETENGKYEITISQNRYDIKALDKESENNIVSFVYDTNKSEWSLINGDDKKVIASINGDTYNIIYPSGRKEAFQLQ